MCVVLSCILGTLASSNVTELSSNTRQCALSELVGKPHPCSFNSCIIGMIGITSQSEFDSATYSASVVLRAMLVCNFELQ